ncbi:hypothetical protein [Amycolatopsis sp. H20-H5]|uniref:hypothetical protein n=1 Tax=Amycolatopsis sp. H20-H5 TaxID=3046309 RepID=UPI002DB98F5E|nr:hypothetical protein [Amycolatopsis sp. H20-H5]MEC3973916.1 hypothetical protein [Amycolatopsis sp. H20-H5]
MSVVLIAVSRMLSTPYQMQATAMIARAVPGDVRGQVSGVTSTALVEVQSLGIMIAGAVAQLAGTAPTIGIAALVGVWLAGAGISWRGFAPPADADAAYPSLGHPVIKRSSPDMPILCGRPATIEPPSAGRR